MDLHRAAETWTDGPGAIAPADGNYAHSPVIPNGVERTEESLFGSARENGREIPRFARNDGKGMNDGERPDDEKGSSTPLDLGPNNERLEEANAELVHALR